jgi:hypothetical protein
MFEKLKAWYRRESISKWVLELHDPLLLLKDRLEKTTRVELEGMAAQLAEKIHDLEAKEGKDDATLVRERWQAIKFRKAIEDYSIALLKLNELIDNLPSLPQVVKYDIQLFNDFNHPDD